MTSFVQKILVDSNYQEFAMKETCKKDVIGIVIFDLIGYFPPITLFITLQWHTIVNEETFDVNS